MGQIILNWVWFPLRQRRSAVRRGLGYTLLILGITPGALLIVDESLRGDSEFVMWGLVLFASASATARPQDPAERPDARCTQCGYCMVGLHESRCPECGHLYTLDELFAEQDPMRSGVRLK